MEQKNYIILKENEVLRMFNLKKIAGERILEPVATISAFNDGEIKLEYQEQKNYYMFGLLKDDFYVNFVCETWRVENKVTNEVLKEGNQE